MNTALIEKVINATLYEGHILYPYRASSKKNQRERFTFGRVYPRAYSTAQTHVEPCLMQTECLVRTAGSTIGNVSVRFLQPVLRDIGEVLPTVKEWKGTEPKYRAVPALRVGEQLFQTWHEAVERRVDAAPIALNLKPAESIRAEQAFEFPAERMIEPIRNHRDEIVGLKIYTRAAVNGLLEVSGRALAPDVFKLTVRISNETHMRETEVADQNAVLMRTFASTHTLLTVQGGEFISLMEPKGASSPQPSPPIPMESGQASERERNATRRSKSSKHPVACRAAPGRDVPRSVYGTLVEQCHNIGTWPVLVGEEGETDAMLSSPIILYDYPKIAPESPGSLFDGTEIDEILTLRIKTLTEAEKTEMRHVDEYARRILERTDSLDSEALLRMHGTMRESEKAREFDDFFGANAGTRLEEVSVAGVRLKAGDRVRLRPKARADAIDMVLAGQTAIVEGLEEDLEKKVHVAVIVENDPGKDLGMMRQPGHRFFYGVDEIEPLGATTE